MGSATNARSREGVWRPGVLLEVRSDRAPDARERCETASAADLRTAVGTVTMATMADLPVACTLDPAALSARRSGLLQHLAGQARERRERDDGVLFTFTPSADLLPFIAEVIEAERRCCRFLRFDLTVEPDEGAVRLQLTGPPGTREFLRELLPREEPC